MQHRAEPADVRATRARAGLIGVAGQAARKGAAFGLDVVLSAPNRLFVRGRGLDAELGGELHLGGTTAAVSPLGAFNLIRGRLDILGKRLDLTEAVLQMEGELIPSLHIVAATVNDGITVAVGIDGPATDPVVSFTSSPDLPEEEVLARANDNEYGLATAIWTQNISRAHRVAAKMEVGIAWVNSWFLRDLRTPFGGAKQSGIGREGGVHSLEFYTELKNICIKL